MKAIKAVYVWQAFVFRLEWGWPGDFTGRLVVLLLKAEREAKGAVTEQDNRFRTSLLLPPLR